VVEAAIGRRLRYAQEEIFDLGAVRKSPASSTGAQRGTPKVDGRVSERIEQERKKL